ncbi:spermidine/putrescine transport system permease protein [Atopostipes suicloacalis DSM 15692]|uniref:Spermidine/putrescine transport system permease protein n=1 Tax=Atopostipes suicloacalis DSM 15692 TaxID=1121025 RepID=A0A1M4WUM6_9LACT|nr:ABC transporter permease [Atopostipes suicloacalis]SHE84991.1 spermidine/putrescine transport system permease protein [Atopostipes suicloacalis DSM 15692]
MRKNNSEVSVQKQDTLLMFPYVMWIVLFVLAPIFLLVYQSLLNVDGAFTFENILRYFTSVTYLSMTFQSFLYAGLITLVTLIISYPAAYILTKTEHKELWRMLLILPTWINILLKAYAFIGILSQSGIVNRFLDFIGIGRQQILFTNFSFLLVASYIELPFMMMPIMNAISEIDPSLIQASHDLGANTWATIRKVILPLSMNGVRSGVQAVFIPSLSLFMLTRLIGGNRVITLGTAIEQHFLVTQNWGMGSTIGIILIVLMFIVIKLTSNKKARRGVSND